MIGGGEALLLNLVWPALGETTARSHMKTCMEIGTLACRWRESFWLREMVSKHRTAPVEETIQGSTFWFETLETTSSLDASIASLYKLLSPDRLEGVSSSPSTTDEMYINPCQ